MTKRIYIRSARPGDVRRGGIPVLEGWVVKVHGEAEVRFDSQDPRGGAFRAARFGRELAARPGYRLSTPRIPR